MKTISILGTVGIPANYGGFETLAENLARFHQNRNIRDKLVVYCSSENYQVRPVSFLGSELRYLNISANGVSSIFYDILSLFLATYRGTDVIFLLGVSGCIALPFVRLFSRVKVITNIDGLEWKRQKWSGVTRWFLRFSESLAVRFSHDVIADNTAIAEHVKKAYARDCKVIAYGGEHALNVQPSPYKGTDIPGQYALALCRIEPENNVAMILDTFSCHADMPLVFIGNWDASVYGRQLKQKYSTVEHLYLLDAIYDVGVLRTIRQNAAIYVHGHSAGGTNPSLVEMMHFGLPVLAFDCVFNRYTTEGKALFFKDCSSLISNLQNLTPDVGVRIASEMSRIANKYYTWEFVGSEYFRLAGIDEASMK